jgi:hypothetical protein
MATKFAKSQRMTVEDQKNLDDRIAALRVTYGSDVVEVGQDGEVTGKAGDGVVVSLGNYTHAPRSLLSYLTANPTPDRW